MIIRRTTANRKRPTVNPPGLGGSIVSASDQPGDDSMSSTQDELLREGVDQIARDFDKSLEGDPALDVTQRRALGEKFSHALQEQVALGAGLPTLPDKQAWTDTVNDLTRSGVLSEGDAADLIRQLDQAFNQFERHETKVALEFGRRLATDGEEKALAWLREQQVQAERPAGTEPVDASAPRSLSSDVVKSRSRRLRGPPNA